MPIVFGVLFEAKPGKLGHDEPVHPVAMPAAANAANQIFRIAAPSMACTILWVIDRLVS
jgi:hypothetical protein